MYKKIFEKRKKIMALVISLILFLIFSFKLNSITTKVNNVDNNKLKISVLTSHIYIDDLGGGDYTWEEAASQDWCSGSGTEVDPYLLENLIIDGSWTVDCITIHNSKADFTIRNCTVYKGDGADGSGIVLYNVTNGKIIENNCTMNGGFGIHFYDCKNNIIANNLVSLNPWPGIWGVDSNDTIISNNEVFDNGWGIYLVNCLENEILDNVIYGITSDSGIDLRSYSLSNIISGNEIRNCYGGINIHTSNGTTVLENIAKDNQNNGINLYDSYNNDVTGNILQNNSMFGIRLFQSNDTVIKNNVLNKNNISGLYLEEASRNKFINNEISDNPFFGALLNISSENNLFHENFFLRNGKHAVDNGSNNDWNSTLIGNYWDNYTGSDADNDGIGDTPHDIPGDAGSKDNLPIWDERAPIIDIIAPLNNSKIGSTAPEFTVEIYDPYLDTMWYTIDGGITNITFTANGTIDQTSWETLWDSSAKGDTITITFYANDTFGHLGFNFIEVKKKIPSEIIGLDFFTTSFCILIISGVVIIAIIAKIHSKKRIIFK